MEKIYQEMNNLAESFYGTQNDSEQIPITEETNRKLRSIHNDTVLWRADEHGEPVSWIVAIPTSIAVMNEFLSEKISERKLFELAVEEKKFEALYLCSVLTMPTYRGKGLAMELSLEAIKKFAPSPEQPLFAWPFSSEGANLLVVLEKKLGRKILLRNRRE